MDKRKKRTVILPSIAAAIIVGAILGITMYASANNQGLASQDAQCLPKSLDSVDVNYNVKQPTASSMPAGFNLEAVDDPGGLIIMYYADHSLCPFDKSFDDQIRNGAIVVTVSNGTGIASDSTDFQSRDLNYYASQNGTIAKVQPIDVNGNKGTGWEPFTGASTVRINGTIVSNEPLQMPGMLRFYDDNDDTVYSISAFQPLDKLLEIARSIH